MDSSGDIPSSAKDAFTKVQAAPPVQQRVDLFRRLLENLTEDPITNPKIPNSLFEEDWAEDSEVLDEKFIRQIIQRLKATREDLWTHLLKTCTPNQSKMLKVFIESSRVHKVAHLFDFRSTRATHEGLQNMEKAKQVRLPFPQHIQGGREPWQHTFKNAHLNLFHLRSKVSPERVDIGLFEDSQRSNPVVVLRTSFLYMSQSRVAIISPDLRGC